MHQRKMKPEKKNTYIEYRGNSQYNNQQHSCKEQSEMIPNHNHTYRQIQSIKDIFNRQLRRALQFLKNKLSCLEMQEKNENRSRANEPVNLGAGHDSECQIDDAFKDFSINSDSSKTIIVVSMVRNEERIIESSIRWWMTFSTKIIIFDHNSTDGTSEIIYRLQEEYGSRLFLFNPSFDTKEYAQAKITNAMIEQAFNRFDADIVMPLDADEFPYLQNNKIKMKEYLCALDLQYCYRTFWMQFAPLRPSEQVDTTVLLPLSFCRKKDKPLNQWPKVIITKNVYKNGPVWVEKGNHVLDRLTGNTLERVATRDLCPDVYYAHYMYLDRDHFIRKVTANWEACKKASDYRPGVSEHYRLAYERIKSGTIDDEALEYYALSVSGMTGESVGETQKSVEEIDPHSIFGMIRLKYTNVLTDV